MQCLPFRLKLSVCALALSALVAPSVFAQSALTHEQAVAAARAGQLATAITSLRALDAVGSDPRVRDDLAVVLAWAGRDAEAVATFERLPADRVAPTYVRLEMTRAYRRLGRFAAAETLARDGRHREPAEADWQHLLPALLADRGAIVEARAQAQARLASHPRDAEAWMVAAHVERQAGDRFAALEAFARALALRPDLAEAKQGTRELWAELGAVSPAIEAVPGPVPLSLLAQAAAGQLRRAIQIPPVDSAQRFDRTDAAIAEFERLIVLAAGAGPAEAGVLRSLRRDRIVALHHRQRWQDTADGAAALRADGDVLPPFVRLAEASALLALRRPAESRDAYAELLAGELAPEQRRDATVGLFFAQSDGGEFEAAIVTADALAAQGEPRRWMGSDPNPRPDTDWLGAQVMAAMARSYAEMPAEAWARLRPLSDGAPALAWLRSSRASVAAQRGWPRLADEEIRIAHSLAPQDAGIRIALADSDQRRRHWDRAAAQVDQLVAVYPQDSSLQRLQREIDAHNRWELLATAGLRREDESANNAPGSGFDGTVRLYSPPLGERWRALAAAERSAASPVEGDVTRYRVGAGLQYRAPDVELNLIGWNNTGTLHREGVFGSVGWQPGDGWSLGAEAERFAADTPLRALYYGISANGVGGSVGYDWHESAGVAASLRQLSFSDGNRRVSWRVAGLLRVVDTPRLDVVLRPEFSSSRNTVQGGPYFNPSLDRSASLAVTAEQRLSQVFEKSLWHAVTVAAGNYWQRDYGSNAIGSLRYEQRWRHDPRTEIGYGLEVYRRAYDGVGENAWLLSANLRHRF